MVKVQNRALFVLLLVAACIAPPVLADARLERLAQAVPPTEDLSTFDAPADGLPAESSLTIASSSSMMTITRSLVQAFEEKYPNVSVTVVEQPSETALQNLQFGNAELVGVGRTLSDEQKAQGLIPVPVSREKIAVIVSPENPFQGQIEAEDFVRIFRGEITNWIELGGPDLPIRFIDRPETSDTRAALGEYEIFGGDLSVGGNVVQIPDDSTAEVVAALGDNGIGYAIASQVINQDNVRVMGMHNALPDDPRYPYSQQRNYVYTETSPLAPEAEAFLALATNPDGQKAVAQAKAAEEAAVAAADLADQVNAVRPNGQGFVTGDPNGNLAFWNIDGTSAGDPVAVHVGPVTALAFSSDGQRLISGGADGTIRFWDAIGNPVGEPINAGNGPVTSLTVGPDDRFVSASADGTIQPWDTTGNPAGPPITGHTDTVRDIAFSGDGNMLITASDDGTIRFWNAEDVSPLGGPLTGHQGAVLTLSMQPDGRFFSGGADGTVRQWGANGTPQGEPLTVSGPVTAIATNADGNSTVVGDETGALQYLSVDGVPVGEPLTDVGAPVDDLALTPDGQRLVVSAGDFPQLRDSTGQIIPIPSSSPVYETNSLDPWWPQLLAWGAMPSMAFVGLLAWSLRRKHHKVIADSKWQKRTVIKRENTEKSKRLPYPERNRGDNITSDELTKTQTKSSSLPPKEKLPETYSIPIDPSDVESKSELLLDIKAYDDRNITPFSKPGQSSPLGRNCGIVVGINNYQNLTPLRYAKNDAELIRSYLRDFLQCHKTYFFFRRLPSYPPRFRTSYLI